MNVWVRELLRLNLNCNIRDHCCSKIQNMRFGERGSAELAKAEPLGHGFSVSVTVMIVQGMPVK